MTRRVDLLGKPLRRRHSVVMHNAAFAAAGIDGEYVLAEIDEADVPDAVAAARGPEFFGLGVTAPYKPLVAALVDDVEPDARAIGAVNNVIRMPDGRLVGFNSDAPGFRAGVELAMGRPLDDAMEVVVVGAGGVARAIVHACLGVGRMTIANRTPEAARALVERNARDTRADMTACGLDESGFHSALWRADLVVNATSVGMIDPGLPFPVDGLRDEAIVFDCVYVPAETPLLAAARARGLHAANGSEMLIAQAAIAFERWTGVSGMASIMREAVAPLLADAATTA
ncbi:MAG: shikimate dehydrogenase [Candidatus Limnocylindrales bacterium]